MENGFEMINREEEYLNMQIMMYLRDFGEMDVDMEKEHIIILMEIDM